jgi:hypothetical protein
VPRHPSFLLKIKITILDIFYISLSLSLYLSLSPSVYLTGEEGVCTLGSIKHAHILSSLFLSLTPSFSLSLSQA